MEASFFKNKKITVYGLGLHGGGVGIVKFLIESGAKVIVTDIKTREQLAPSIEKLKGLKNIQYVLGQHRSEDFTKVDMVIKLPPIRAVTYFGLFKKKGANAGSFPINSIKSSLS